MRATGQAPGGTARLLVVDDDRVIRELVAEVLEGEGYAVARAANGAEALGWLAERRRLGEPPPTLILLDMRMPMMDGWTFAAEYRRSSGPRAPIVVMTAAADAAACAAEVGAEGVLAKPFGLDALLTAVGVRTRALR